MNSAVEINKNNKNYLKDLSMDGMNLGESLLPFDAR